MYIQWTRALPREGFECIYNGKEAKVGHGGGCVHIYIYMINRNVCMYVCMYVYIYIYIYTYMYIRTRARQRQARNKVDLCIYIYIYTHTLFAHTNYIIHLCTNNCICTHTHTPAQHASRTTKSKGCLLICQEDCLTGAVQLLMVSLQFPRCVYC